MKELYKWLEKGPQFFNSFLLEQLQDLGIVIEVQHYESDMSDLQEEAISTQWKIGVWASMWGLYNKELVTTIERFFAGTRTIGTHWLARVVTKLWDVYDLMWNARNQV
jgi:hypothetical protein